MSKSLKVNTTIAEDYTIKYLVGVDGGGSGTRVIVTDKKLQILASAQGDPSALGQGIEKAWRSIVDTLARAFHYGNIPVPMLSECAIGLGLSGANNVVWKNEFYMRNPGFKNIIVDTDGFTTLLGAHGGRPGVVVAVGTGSVGMVLNKEMQRKDVSGWGFPAGDEASGAWLGLRAASITQKTIDGRRASSTLSELVLKFCGKEPEQFLNWLGNAGQNSFAQLAPLVFQAAPTDVDAKNLLIKAGIEIELMAKTLDPEGSLPLSICGRLGEALIPYLPEATKKRTIPAHGDSTIGALLLIAEGK
ncbi:MAG: ATPase [Rhizobacter sp.]|nr:ATPase [Bacteriovorax sp.]